ncbi:MAG: iron ABC transporter permease [Bacteroidota bacterium]
MPKNRSVRALVTIGLLGIALLITIVTSIGVGAISIETSTVVKVLWSKVGTELAEDEYVQSSAIIFGIRFPRTIMAVLIGGALSICGAALQGLFRNPLADPQLIGVSGGAALAAAASIIWVPTVAALSEYGDQNWFLPLAAFLGGLVSTFVVYRISGYKGKTSVSTMLLAGIAINAFTAAGIGYLIFTADDNQIRDLTFWLLGSLGSSTWETVYVAFPFLLFTILVLPLLGKKMNVLLMGEREAAYLGVNVEVIKRVIIVLCALGVGVSVSVSGIIGFVGLVIPHILRLMIGTDHRFLLPASVLLGALLLLASDVLARTIVVPAELPIGIVTAFAGAPFFLWLLLRNRTAIHSL